MRKFTFLIIVAAAAAGAYLLLWTGERESVLSPPAGGESGAVQGGTRRFFVSGENVLSQAGDWLLSAPQSAQETISDAVSSWGDDIRKKAAEALLPPSEEDLNLPEAEDAGPVSPPAPASAPPGGTEVEVCLAGAKDKGISYYIENPYSPQSGFAYEIDWGDGETYAASVEPPQKSASVSHTYSSAGAYVARFEFQTVSGPVVITRKTCVQ